MKKSQTQTYQASGIFIVLTNFDRILSNLAIFSCFQEQGVAGHMFRTEPVIAENRFTKITIGDNQKSL